MTETSPADAMISTANAEGAGSKMLKLRFYIFVFVATVFLFVASGVPWIEATFQFQVAQSLVKHHTLSTSDQVTNTQIQGIDGRWYDYHGMTNVLLMLPIAAAEPIAVAFLHQNADRSLLFVTALTGVVTNALTCVLFFSTLILFGLPRMTSWYATVCLAFLTLVFPYSSNNFESNLNMLVIIGSLYFLFSFQATRATSSLIWSAIFAGLAINTRDFSLIVLFWMSIYVSLISYKQGHASVAVVFFLSLAPLLSFWAWSNWLRTGSYYLSPVAAGILSGRYTVAAPSGSFEHGLRGLLLSKGGSIFVYSPILLYSIVGWRSFIRNQRSRSLLILAITATWLLCLSKVWEWFGFWCWGPRYTLEITPLMTLPLGYCLNSSFLRGKVRTAGFAALAAWSLTIQLAGTLTNWHGRLQHLLSARPEEYALFTAVYSQWVDSVRTLGVNFWNACCGRISYIANPGYDPAISDASLYASNTIFTWWNRLLYLGVSPYWIALYVLASAFLAAISLRKVIALSKADDRFTDLAKSAF